ncbi:cytokine receptor-like [Anopheles cruzii]|uniref:cytokine receptor-like n=1 Tax=Anopheles cruzii TaxID=68878 RepID=UPI0022EC26B8|nr:cytokine receptor-like [Anopheles cruzii]
MARTLAVILIWWLCSFSEVSSLGWIFPQEPIYREVNESFRLQCTLNVHSRDARGSDSSNLMFYRADEPVPREQVRIINTTTIELTVDRAVPSNDYAYTCKLNDTKGVAIRSVYIGHKPQLVQDFQCRAPLWSHQMNCTFTPDPNSVQTTYDLVFHFEPIIQNFSCALRSVEHTHLKECIIDSSNGYRHVNEHYYFTLTATNKLGTLSQRFDINHFDVVVPHEPNWCTIDNSSITSDSAVAHWRIWYKYASFRRNFTFEVKLLSIFHDGVWQEISTDGLRRSQLEYTLPLLRLPYADTLYDVRIRMRTDSPVKGEDMWSNYTSCFFNTMSRRPDMPPDVAYGIFENANDHLFLYWRELHKWQHNARNGFYYNITKLGPDGRVIEHLNATGGMIHLRYVQDMNYTFVIRSANADGLSERSSKVLVPSKRHRPEKPEIDKLLSDSGKFTLSWKRPSRSAPITSYTVFWCNTTSNSPNDCNGSINFTTIAASRTTFELSDAGSTLNFAVAANIGHLSSGMVWAACTATHKTDIGKLKTLWITEMLATYINLKWKTECGDVAHTGYMIYYCPISSPRTLGCKEPERAVNVTDKSQYYCRLENLKPYVTYKIEIAMYSETHIGPRSEPLVNTTREAAPSPPRELTLRSVTNDSVTLHWLAPEQLNSGKMSYEIQYNGHSVRVNVEDPTTEVEQILHDLDAFSEYDITVRALTIGYSNATGPLRVRTLVGQPQAIAQPSTNSSSDSKLMINWHKPIKSGGCVEFYELKMKTKESVVYRQRTTECQLRQAICQNRESSKYEFSVRAVNVVGSGTDFEGLSCADRWLELQQLWPALGRSIAGDGDGECGGNGLWQYDSENDGALGESHGNFQLLYGPWSEPLAHWCSLEDQNALTPIITILLLGVIFVLCLSYFKVKDVFQVKVIIPDGLTNITGSGKPDIMGSKGNIIFVADQTNHPAGGVLVKEESLYSKEQKQCLLSSSSSSGCGGSVADLSAQDQRSAMDYFSNSGRSEDDSTSFYDQEAERQDLHRFGVEPSDVLDNQMDCTECPPEFDTIGTMGESQHKSSAAASRAVTSGYVPAPLAMNPINASGYLKLSTLTNGGVNMISPDGGPKSINAKIVAAPIGYVTHKQLSAYGQHLK